MFNILYIKKIYYIYKTKQSKTKNMGAIKEIMVELQNQYGYDLEYLPEDFDWDAHFKSKSEEPNSEND